VVDLLAAMNTGHEGGCGTLHANSAADVPARLEALALAAGLDRAATHSQLASGVAAVIHLARGRDGVRRVTEVAVPRRDREGLVGMVPAVVLDGATLREGPGAAALAEALGRAW
jgi:pilus assembly protein CpaF